MGLIFSLEATSTKVQRTPTGALASNSPPFSFRSTAETSKETPVVSGQAKTGSVEGTEDGEVEGFTEGMEDASSEGAEEASREGAEEDSTEGDDEDPSAEGSGRR